MLIDNLLFIVKSCAVPIGYYAHNLPAYTVHKPYTYYMYIMISWYGDV